MPRKPAATESDWVLDSVVAFLRSPLWQTPIQNFVDEHCICFPSENSQIGAIEQGQFGQTEIHMNFQELVENLLETYLKEIGISSEDFIMACAASSNPEMSSLVLEYILAMDDFLTFKKLMEKRNMELELEALKLLKRQIDNRNLEMKDREIASALSTGDEEVLAKMEKEQKSHVKDANAPKSLADYGEGMYDDEEAAIAAAIAASLQDEAVSQKQKAVEDAELEKALVLSNNRTSASAGSSTGPASSASASASSASASASSSSAPSSSAAYSPSSASSSASSSSCSGAASVSPSSASSSGSSSMAASSSGSATQSSSASSASSTSASSDVRLSQPTGPLPPLVSSKPHPLVSDSVVSHQHDYCESQAVNEPVTGSSTLLDSEAEKMRILAEYVSTESNLTETLSMERIRQESITQAKMRSKLMKKREAEARAKNIPSETRELPPLRAGSFARASAPGLPPIRVDGPQAELESTELSSNVSSAPLSQNVSEDEMQRRAEYLRAQRDKLISERTRKRESQLMKTPRDSVFPTHASPGDGGAVSPTLDSYPAKSSSHASETESDLAKRMEVRIALAERVKEDFKIKPKA